MSAEKLKRKILTEANYDYEYEPSDRTALLYLKHNAMAICKAVNGMFHNFCLLCGAEKNLKNLTLDKEGMQLCFAVCKKCYKQPDWAARFQEAAYKFLTAKRSEMRNTGVDAIDEIFKEFEMLLHICGDAL